MQVQAARRRGVGLALFLAAASACGDQPPEPLPPDFVVISVDTLRADHLGIYGYERPTSPNIDALASNGAIFDNAISTSSWTLPAHGSLLTGLFPGRHRLQDDGVKLGREVPLLAETLRSHGYETFAIVSHVYVSRKFGLERGFDDFDDSLLAGGSMNPTADRVVDRFIERLAKVGEGPFFALIHLFDPHWPYTAPPAFRKRFVDPDYRGKITGSTETFAQYFSIDHKMPDADRRQMIALYDAEIAYLDQQIGRLSVALAESGRAGRLVVFLTADHGEEFKEHGQLGHARTLFGEVLNVPLVVSGHPALAGGVRRGDLVSIIDVAPTVLDMAGLPVPEGLDGRSLLREVGEDRTLFAESIRMAADVRTARRGRYKLIETPYRATRELYDLASDPLEQEPLESDPTNGELGLALAEYRAETESGWHLKVIALGMRVIRLRGEIRTPGRLVEPRYYVSESIQGRSAEIRRFRLGDQGGQEGESGDVLELDIQVANHVLEIVFDTDPPDAPVTFDLAMTDVAGSAGMFIGRGERLRVDGPISLDRDDPRLAGEPANYWASTPGVYIRAVNARRGGTEPVELSKQVLEHLEALGYGATEPD